MFFKRASRLLLTWNLFLSPSAFARPLDREEVESTSSPTPENVCGQKNDDCSSNVCCYDFECKKSKCKKVKPIFELFKVFAGGSTDGYNGGKLELGYGLEMSASGSDLIFPPYEENSYTDPKQTFVQYIDYDTTGMAVTLPQHPKNTILSSEVNDDFDEYRSEDYWAGSVSGDGKVLAVANSAENSYNGALRTYSWKGEWAQIDPFPLTSSEEDVNGEQFGSDVALSHNGKIMVVCAEYTSSKGYCQRYDRSGNSWNTQGEPIFGDTDDYLGRRIVMDKLGDRIAVSSEEMAHVQVYDWSSDDESWSKVWTFTSDGYTDYFAYSTIQISNNGKIIAIGDEEYGESYSEGIVVVYEQDTDTNSVEFKEIFLEKGPGEDAYYGYAFALSGDGKTLAISDYQFDENIVIYKKKKGTYKKDQVVKKKGTQTDRVRLNEKGNVLAIENNPDYARYGGEIHVWSATTKSPKSASPKFKGPKS